MASTAPSKITTHDLYIESLEELLMAAREYVTKVPNTPIALDPMAMLHAELDAQRKQFELIMKQNLDLLTNMAQNGGGNGSGGGGGGGGDNEGGVKVKDSKIKIQRSAPTVARWRCTLQRFVSPWRPTRTRSQQTGNDRDRG
jgi:hypothetical protein